jgi:hypothetical protein
LEKPRCPFVNLVGDNIFAPMNQLLKCAFYNLFGDGTSALIYKPLDLDAWPKSKNGKKIHCPNISNYPFYKKTNGRWDELLKPHY